MIETIASTAEDPELLVAQSILETRALRGVKLAEREQEISEHSIAAIFKDSFIGGETRRFQRARAALRQAKTYSRAVFDIAWLTLFDDPEGSLHIGGSLFRSPFTRRFDGTIYDVDLTANCVVANARSGFRFETTATVNGMPVGPEVAGRLINVYVAPLRARNAIRNQLITTNHIRR